MEDIVITYILTETGDPPPVPYRSRWANNMTIFLFMRIYPLTEHFYGSEVGVSGSPGVRDDRRESCSNEVNNGRPCNMGIKEAEGGLRPEDQDPGTGLFSGTRTM
jgi:hypothetical protein